MSTGRTTLFSPWKLGQLELTNRIVIPPLCMYSCDTEGCPGSFHDMHVGSMATSGAGLVIVEATAVVPEGRITPRCPGLWNDKNAEAFKKLLAGVRTYSSTPLTVQLAHAGRKASFHTPFEQERGQRGQYPADSDLGWQTVAPSPLGYDEEGGEMKPSELSLADIESLIQKFAEAARRADTIAGFDGIELHFAHGYLVHQFLSPLSNLRPAGDKYTGTTFEGRIRLAKEIFAAVRAAVDPRKPVWVRISATDWMETNTGDDKIKNTTNANNLDSYKSWTIEQSVELSKELKQLGCAAIHVSTGGLHKEQRLTAFTSYQTQQALRIRLDADIPVMAVGLITEPHQAETILNMQVHNKEKDIYEGIDAIAIGRAFLYNPRWPYRAAHELKDKLVGSPQFWRCEPYPPQDIFIKK